jgi:CHAT domain-containing protein/Tfp pilus assembly protein PilF
MKPRLSCQVITFLFTLLVSFGSMNTVVAKASWQLTREVKPTHTTGQGEQDVRLLEMGKPIEREMKGGEAHAYQVTLAAGQFLRVLVDQRGIDVVVTLFGPDDKKVIDVDSPNGIQGPEPVLAIAEMTGEHLLKVQSLEKSAKPGRYEIKVEKLRNASEADQKRVRAERGLVEGKRLQAQGTGESLREAIAKYEEFVRVSHEAGDRAREASTLNSLGVAYDSLGDNKKALQCHDQASQISRKIGDRIGEARSLANMGIAYNLLSRKQKALQAFEQALQILHQMKDLKGEATTLMHIGLVYDSLNDKQKALKYYNEALPLLQKVKDRRGEATLLNNIGVFYDSLGNKQKALEYYEQALPILHEVGDFRGESASLSNIGLVYSLSGDKQKALGYYNTALNTSRNAGDRTGEAAALKSIGSAYAALGEVQKAFKYLDQALRISQDVKDRELEAATLNYIGRVYDSLGEKRKALDLYQKTIQVLEDMRAESTIEELKIGLIGEDASLVYRRASYLLMSLGKTDQAFNFTERARARTFLDQLGNVRPHIHKSVSDKLLKKEEDLRLDLALLEHALRQERTQPVAALNVGRINSLATQLDEKRAEYANLLTSLKLTNREYASMRSVDSLTVFQLQEFVHRDTTLLSYFVTEYKTLVFMITQNSFRAVEIPVEETELEGSVKWFRSFADLHDSRPQSLLQLYGWLIAPIKQYLKTPMIGIIPHGILHYLPFAALTDGKRYLGDEYTIFYLPSGSVLPFIQKKSKPVGTRLLAISQSQAQGYPSLRYADGEVAKIAKLYNTQAFHKGNAAKSEFQKRGGEYSIIHIAAHAELNTDYPLFSRIIFGSGQDGTGALEVNDIYNLDLSKSSLVMLSACETQLGAQSKGDDIIGLNRAFIYAGAPTVIASLWAVDDVSTSQLMKFFYIHLKEGMIKAEALRAAQSDTRKKYPHPYHWAGFVLTGDPGQSTTDPAIQRKQAMRPLEVGKPIEREMSEGEVHQYRVHLNAGQFLHAVVNQQGVDVLVTMVGPDSKQVLEVNDSKGAKGVEPVLAIAEVTGEHLLKVQSLGKSAKPGRYEIRVEELRNASGADQKRVRAERGLAEGRRLQAEGTAESLREAIAKYEEFVRVSHEAGDRAREANTLNSLGVAYDSLGDKQKATEYFILALPIRREVGDRIGEADTLMNIGGVYELMGNKQKALEYFELSVPILKEVGDRKKEATTLTNIGAIYNSMSDKQKALQAFEQALQIMREMKDPGGEASALNSLAAVYSSLGNKQKALEYYDQALQIRRNIMDRRGEARTLRNLGIVCNSLGNKQKALEYFNLALPILQEVGDRREEAATLLSISVVYESLGNKQKALEYYDRAMKIKRD